MELMAVLEPFGKYQPDLVAGQVNYGWGPIVPRPSVILYGIAPFYPTRVIETENFREK